MKTLWKTAYQEKPLVRGMKQRQIIGSHFRMWFFMAIG